MSRYINIHPNLIRKQVCDYMQNSMQDKSIKIDGTPLSEWLDMESDNASLAYINNMRQPNIWGGALEIIVASILYKLKINVHNTRDNSVNIVFESPENENYREIDIYWNGSHYFIPNNVKEMTPLVMHQVTQQQQISRNLQHKVAEQQKVAQQPTEAAHQIESAHQIEKNQEAQRISRHRMASERIAQHRMASERIAQQRLQVQRMEAQRIAQYQKEAQGPAAAQALAAAHGLAAEQGLYIPRLSVQRQAAIQANKNIFNMFQKHSSQNLFLFK